jgi:ferritin
MSAIADTLGAYVPHEEDVARCYLQLAAWADTGNRHRTSKYFYRGWAQHACRVKELGKMAADNGGAVRYAPLLAAYDGDSNAAGTDMAEWFSTAFDMETALLERMEDLAESLTEQKARAAAGLVKQYIKQTVLVIARLRRQVAHLQEAKGDVAALQAFDRNL